VEVIVEPVEILEADPLAVPVEIGSEVLLCPVEGIRLEGNRRTVYLGVLLDDGIDDLEELGLVVVRVLEKICRVLGHLLRRRQKDLDPARRGGDKVRRVLFDALLYHPARHKIVVAEYGGKDGGAAQGEEKDQLEGYTLIFEHIPCT